ncbi:MAG: phosphogluconate dehydratase [Kordiimonadaceae bacterium]|jgi:phosphogluconate dehydratase|nr:phosphogluconate dehydratase [Kordiimonadaceae bacterium]
MVLKIIQEVTNRITERSASTRQTYLEHLSLRLESGKKRSKLGCGNIAHAIAACSLQDKNSLVGEDAKNFAIVTSYNDMLSAHAPYDTYPQIIKKAAMSVGSVAQVAGGVPAMCDGVTQGQVGMELSLFSREVIALSTAVALSHDMFEGAFYLGICDKIVPGLMMGALSFGHLPSIFVPAGPMPTGLPNAEKARIRQLYAEEKVGREELLEAESKSYHSAGTCTFYGTANSNQMLMEIMGLQLPGSSFINPQTDMREKMTVATVKALDKITAKGNLTPLGHIVSEKTLVNGLVGLLATGGSTNLTLHIIAIARAAGIHITWQDLSDLSENVPLLTRIYPNGLADINHFQAAGGMSYLIKELLKGGYLHNDVQTVVSGSGLEAYAQEAFVNDEGIYWKDGAKKSLDEHIIRPYDNPFASDGGVKSLKGNIGNSIIKTSAVKKEHRHIKAPAKIFHCQDALHDAFHNGDLNQDFVAVIRFQGPKANGMPELHKLTPPLGVLQDKGYHIALITDGRMSGASGKVPAAIHISPEAIDGGVISLIQEGDIIELDAVNGNLVLHVDDEELKKRIPETIDISSNSFGLGRELFAGFRNSVGPAEKGATIFEWGGEA